MALPITLDEIRPQVKAMFLPLDHDMKVKYTLVNINNQFKIAGIFTSSAHVSTFTLDLQQNVPRQFIYEALHNVIKYMKHNFKDFIATSHKYTTPFLHYTHNTIFYYLNQINYRILETIAHIQQSYPQIVDQLVTQPTPQPATQNLDTHNTLPTTSHTTSHTKPRHIQYFPTTSHTTSHTKPRDTLYFSLLPKDTITSSHITSISTTIMSTTRSTKPYF